MKIFTLVILVFLSLNVLAKKELKQKSMFIEKGNRGMSHFGVTSLSFDKVGLNIGGDFLFHIDDDFFVGFTLDSTIFKYKLLNETHLTDLTEIGVNTYFEFYSEENYSFDAILGAGLMITGFFSWDDYVFTPFLGVSWNYKKVFTRIKYTFLGITSGKNDYMVSFVFGFLIDLRPKKLNKGYYNDEF